MIVQRGGLYGRGPAPSVDINAHSKGSFMLSLHMTIDASDVTITTHIRLHGCKAIQPLEGATQSQKVTPSKKKQSEFLITTNLAMLAEVVIMYLLRKRQKAVL